MIEVPVYLNMLGASGVAKDTAGNNVIFVPQQYRGKIAYINFQNLTDNTIKVFAPHDDITSANPVYVIGARMMFSLKLTQNLGEGVQLVFTNPDAATNAIVKALEIFWTDGSKNWNHSLATSYNGGVNIGGVTITNPIDGSGGIKTSIVAATPLPCNETGKAWASHVFAGAGNFDFKVGAGTVFAMIASAAMGQQLNDGAAAAWKSGDIVGIGYPIACATKINVSVTGACTVWILYA